MLKIYNTLGRQLQEFKSLKDKEVKIYHCGPTVYWTQHIGNLRAMTEGDLVRRTLEYLGYDVKYVRNYTDFGHLTGDNIGDADQGEDRMEKTAKKEKMDPTEVADKYISQFENDTKKLNIKEPTKKTRATDYIEQMKKMVAELLDKGFAYLTPNAIYFDISRFPEYTNLSRQKLDKNITGAGFGDYSDDKEKRNPQDFALWFFKTGSHKNALQFWPSDFKSPDVENGEGIPGWHIECSAMARSELGSRLDIHIGGVEHISIHHTNEIAQSESANGEKYVNYWVHNEHLTLNGEKMSKSDGNVLFLDDIIEKGYTGLDLRYFFMQAHYRSKQNFTWEALEAAATGLKRLRKEVAKSKELSKIEDGINREFNSRFIQAIEDDFNLPKAVAVVWETLKSPDSKTFETILDFDKVLGLDLSEESVEEISTEKIDDKLQELIDQRAKARLDKDFQKSDDLRDKMRNEYGYEIIDGENGTQTLRKV